jgi:hypothetical protein
VYIKEVRTEVLMAVKVSAAHRILKARGNGTLLQKPWTNLQNDAKYYV